MHNKLAKFLLAGCLSIFLSTDAIACNAETTPIPASFNFGAKTTLNVAQNNIAYSAGAAGNFVITCPVALSLVLLSADWVSFTLVDRLQLKNGSNAIDLQLGYNPSFTPPFTAQNAYSGQLALGSLLNLTLLGDKSLRIPMYLRTVPTDTWPAPGVYSGTFRVALAGTICTATLIGICVGWTSFGPNVITSFYVELTVEKYCQFITVPSTHDMGEVGLLSAATDTQIGVTVRCGQSEDFLMYATAGLSHNGSYRRLRSPALNYIGYDIYHPGAAGTQLLGLSSVDNPYSATGTGNNQTLNFPVRVRSGQTTPIAGTYRDTIAFVIEY